MVSATGIILAGGLSKRMGRDKAFVELEGQPLITRVLKKLRAVCHAVIIVTNSPDAFAQFAPFGVTLAADYFPGKGSLGGIYSGLRAASTDYALTVACDMPLLNENLLRYLLECAAGYDAVIPSAPDPSKPKHRKDGKATAKDVDLHPLHAVYSKNCLAAIEDRLRADDLRMISFHSSVRVRVVTQDEINRFDPRHLSFFNVNTPDDLRFAEQILKSEQ